MENSLKYVEKTISTDGLKFLLYAKEFVVKKEFHFNKIRITLALSFSHVSLHLTIKYALGLATISEYETILKS